LGQDRSIIYSVGSVVSSSETGLALVRFSVDQGINWSILAGSEYSAYSEGNWLYNQFLGFAAETGGGLYVCGQLYNQSGQSGMPESGWIVREFHPNGVWGTTEIFRPGFGPCDTVPTSAGSTKARAIGFFGTDGVIVVGQLRGLYNNFWTVRRSTDQGATWATVDSLQTIDGWSGWLSG
jgi:hypothetical protein